jgi:adenosylcobinamide-phosphate synthase
MFTFGLTGGAQGFDPLVLMLIALVVEAYVGEARAVFRVVRHPVVLIGQAVDVLDRKLNREQRSEMDRAVRGLLVVAVVSGLCGVFGWAVAWLTQNHTFGWIVELALVVALLAQRSLYERVRDVAQALHGEGLDQARSAVAHIVGRDPSQLDEFGVARAAIESCAENFCDGVVAPVFWYILFGFPGLLVYKAVNTMDSMIGYKTPRHRAFGMTAARLDDVLNLIPARLAGLFVVLAALFLPKARPGGALKVMLRDAGKHRSPNAGWPEGAMAGALNLALAGPRHYAERTVNDPWIGDGSARAASGDIMRALYVYGVACLLNGIWVAAVAMIRFSLPG